jgi:hypothetical protein
VGKFKSIATAELTADVVSLYMLAHKYKRNLMSLLALYELYGRDIFAFFYVMGAPNDECFIGKTAEELIFPKELSNLPTDASLKLVKTRAKKVADALRRRDAAELSGVNKQLYDELDRICKRPTGRTPVLNFYGIVEEK